jgi:uncharacterized phiE125 gp8 family phage protein
MIEVVERPVEALITLEEAKAHLKVEHDDEDAVILAYVQAASERLDGPAGICGRAFRRQRLRISLPGFCEQIELPYPPLVAVHGVTYLDSNGDEQTFAEAGNWRVIGVGTEQGGAIVPLYGVEWPSLLATADPDLVRIEFTAGYVSASSPDDDILPKAIKQACKLMVSDFYEFRPSTVIGTTAAQLPHGVEMLIAPYRTAGVYMAVA